MRKLCDFFWFVFKPNAKSSKKSNLSTRSDIIEEKLLKSVYEIFGKQLLFFSFSIIFFNDYVHIIALYSTAMLLLYMSL